MTRVMIVDDEFFVRVGIKSSIDWENNGFEVSAEADNGVDALNILRDTHIDILLLDIEMPKMNGLELLEHIKQEKINVKVIVLSSHNDFDYVRRALKMGCVDYILKLSIEPDQLLSLLNTVKTELTTDNPQTATSDEQSISQMLECISQNKSISTELLRKVLKNTNDSLLTVLSIAVDHYDDTAKGVTHRNGKYFEKSIINIIYGVIND